MRERLRSERGQAATELVGILLWIILIGLAVWQLLIVMWAYAQASNAARTGSRVEARHGDPEKAARNALSPGLRDHLEVRQNGESVTVRVRIPILVPGFYSDDVRATRTATLPG